MSWGCKCIWENCDSFPDALERKEWGALDNHYLVSKPQSKKKKKKNQKISRAHEKQAWRATRSGSCLAVNSFNRHKSPAVSSEEAEKEVHWETSSNPLQALQRAWTLKYRYLPDRVCKDEHEHGGKKSEGQSTKLKTSQWTHSMTKKTNAYYS